VCFTNIAVKLATITFNDGMVGLQPSIGGDVSSSTVAFLRDQDAIRLQRAQEKEEEASKRRKAQRTQRKSAQERLTEQEGVFYSPGGF
jgi:hypothetical protein